MVVRWDHTHLTHTQVLLYSRAWVMLGTGWGQIWEGGWLEGQ